MWWDWTLTTMDAHTQPTRTGHSAQHRQWPRGTRQRQRAAAASTLLWCWVVARVGSRQEEEQRRQLAAANRRAWRQHRHQSYGGGHRQEQHQVCMRRAIAVAWNEDSFCRRSSPLAPPHPHGHVPHSINHPHTCRVTRRSGSRRISQAAARGARHPDQGQAKDGAGGGGQ